MKAFRERTRRLELAIAFAVLLGAFAVSGAAAADFEGDTGPCHETPGDAALLRCPTAYVGAPYEVKIAVEEGSGCDPAIWFEVVNSALPGGLSISRDGVISGVPTGAGFTRFWLWLHDLTQAEGGPSFCQRDDVSQREFSISVDPGLAIVNASVKQATVGQPYAETLATKQVATLSPPTGPDVQSTWSVQSGSLPPGLVLSPQGMLTGTPTTEGSYLFVVQAQNGGVSTTGTFNLTVRQPLVVTSSFGSAKSPRAEVGIRFTTAPTAKGGNGTYAWSISSGALPAGISLNTTNGTISGSPRAPGSFRFGLTATDGEGRATTVNVALNVSAKLAIKPVRLKTATLGRPYASRLATAGGVQPVTWKTVGGKLPPGVRLASKTGALAGVPRRTGNFRVTVAARDALGATSRKSFLLLVRS